MGKKISRKNLQAVIFSPVCSFFIFFTAALFLGFFRDLTNVDELWNYSFADNLASGRLPYRDFNLLQTPVSCMINALGLKIFGSHLLVIRGLGALLFAGICQVLYLMSRQLGAKGIFLWLVPGWFLMFFEYNVFFEYSCLILFCLLISLLADFKGVSDDIFYERWWFQILIGIFGGIAVMSKQTYGGLVAAGAWIALLIVCSWRRYSKGRAAGLLFFRMLGTSVPCFAVLFYFLEHGLWGDFMDMSVYGISEFTSSFTFVEFMKEKPEQFFTGLLFILLVLGGLILTFIRRKTEQGHLMVLVFSYGAAGCINLYPLANLYHVSTCLIPFLLLVIPLTARIREKVSVRWGMRLVFLAAAAYIFLIKPIWTVQANDLKAADVPNFEYTFWSDENWNTWRVVEDYIGGRLEEGRQVYVLDNQAPLYLMPFGEYHKYLDMFLTGNLGTKTAAQCLEESLTDGSIYLIPDETRRQYQYPRKAVLTFAENYLDKIQELEAFEIYDHQVR